MNQEETMLFTVWFTIKNLKLKTLKKEDYAEAILGYEEQNPPEGFPFPYHIELTYRLSDKNYL